MLDIDNCGWLDVYEFTRGIHQDVDVREQISAKKAWEEERWGQNKVAGFDKFLTKHDKTMSRSASWPAQNQNQQLYRMNKHDKHVRGYNMDKEYLDKIQ